MSVDTGFYNVEKWQNMFKYTVIEMTEISIYFTTVQNRI